MFTIDEAQCRPSPDAEQDDKHGLYGVDDEDKEKGVVVDHSVENEHRLDSKVPWTGSVGRRHHHGNASHNESHHGTTDAKMAGEIEAEECEIVVEKITAPDGKGENDEQWHVSHIS